MRILLVQLRIAEGEKDWVDDCVRVSVMLADCDLEPDAVPDSEADTDWLCVVLGVHVEEAVCVKDSVCVCELD